jgi:hypothetical protein
MPYQIQLLLLLNSFSYIPHCFSLQSLHCHTPQFQPILSHHNSTSLTWLITVQLKNSSTPLRKILVFSSPQRNKVGFQWLRLTQAIAAAQGVTEPLDPSYIPLDIQELELLKAKQLHLYSIFAVKSRPILEKQ